LPQFVAVLLRDHDRKVLATAMEAVSRLGVVAATPEILAALGQLLRHSAWSVRSAAAGATGELGVVAATPEILAALGQLLRDPDEMVRSASADAVDAITRQGARLFFRCRWFG
jgi:HEAT repeat protein